MCSLLGAVGCLAPDDTCPLQCVQDAFVVLRVPLHRQKVSASRCWFPSNHIPIVRPIDQIQADTHCCKKKIMISVGVREHVSLLKETTALTAVLVEFSLQIKQPDGCLATSQTRPFVHHTFKGQISTVEYTHTFQMQYFAEHPPHDDILVG